MDNKEVSRVLVIVGSKRCARQVLRCGRAVAGGLNCALRCICYGDGAFGETPQVENCAAFERVHMPQEAVSLAGGAAGIKMLVSDWPATQDKLNALLQMQIRCNVPMAVIRSGERKPPERALVLSSGGPHILHHFWVAREISKQLKLSPRILCI